jgi:hypothetical protein
VAQTFFDVSGFKACVGCKRLTAIDIRWVRNSDIQLKNASLSPPIEPILTLLLWTMVIVEGKTRRSGDNSGRACSDRGDRKVAE